MLISRINILDPCHKPLEHKDIKLETNKESFLKTVLKPNFKSGICLNENLMGCEMGKTKVTVNNYIRYLL